MDLRTKLVFVLVAASLASMLALATLAYTVASDLLRQKTLRQLDALAETKRDDLEKVIAGWEDRVFLIASRTQLRLSLRAHNRSPSPEQRQRIQRILTDARRSSDALHSLAVYDNQGNLVAAAGEELERPLPQIDPASTIVGDTITPPEILFTVDQQPRVDYRAPLILEGERIGTLEVVLTAQELVDLVHTFIGLGETGETMIVVRDSAGVTRVLHPLRGEPGRAAALVGPGGAADPASRAIQGRDTVVSAGLIDYRGERVWAATRYLPEVGWGVVVKFDAEEERAASAELRQRLTRLGLSLSAFAILLGTLLGLRLAKPIHDLGEVANRIRLGELDARAETGREDELGLLARTFNQMAEELEQQMTLLYEFRKYFEVSLDMLCIAGTDGYFKRVNPAFERTLGWSSEELLSRPFVDFAHPDDVEATLREMEKLNRGIPTVSFENRYRCADGGYKHLLWTSYPDPKTGLIYAIARDVTGSGRGEARGDADAVPGPGDRT